jgi:rhodanese-related sulfurtransferase
MHRGMRERSIAVWPGFVLPVLAAVMFLAAGPATGAAPNGAKICLVCHAPEPGNLLGNWESVAMKSSSILLKIDDRSEVFLFDKATVQVLNAPVKDDVEKMLRSIRSGQEVRVRYAARDGVKYASVVASMPAVKLPAQETISLADVEKLVAQGPGTGGYTLIDCRPAFFFKEGAIPTAINLPFPEFDRHLDRLPADKDRLVVFYCLGVTCAMSPGSQAKAKALGYTNVKSFVGGMPEWLGRNYGVLTARSFREAYKEISCVLLDARDAGVARRGHIPGAVTFPAADDDTLQSLPGKDRKPPIVVYDGDGSGNARDVASRIVRAGYTGVMVLSDGYAGWKGAKLPVKAGHPATRIVYAPRPKPGEFPVDPFEKMLGSVPKDTILLDVRTEEEANEEMIHGAVNIPADEVDRRIAELPVNKRIIAYCNTGVRAEMAYHILKSKGRRNVFFLNAKVDFDEGEPWISK